MWYNSEQLPIALMSRPAIANTPVVGSAAYLDCSNLGSPTVLRIWFALSTLSLKSGWSSYFPFRLGSTEKPLGNFGNFSSFFFVFINSNLQFSPDKKCSIRYVFAKRFPISLCKSKNVEVLLYFN